MTVYRALALCLVLAACRDPNAGPPPRTLDEPQRARVEARTRAAAPAPRLVPAGGAVTLGGGKVRYHGADVVPAPAVRGGVVALTHYWEALEQVGADWKVFVHLGAPGARGVLVNGDHVPVEGLWPTSRWTPGVVYADAHTLVLPEGYAGESLELSVGLYRYQDRMPVDRRGAHDGENRIRLGPVAVAGGALPLPEYRAPRASVPPEIDGRPVEAAWDAAPRVFLARSDGRGAPELGTEARLLWDETHLYIAFFADDPDAFSRFEADDDPLYEEEVVEVFIDADGDGRTYNELQVAPTGRIFDAKFDGPRQGMDLSWSSQMRAAAHVAGRVNDDGDVDRGWTVEMAVPHASLYAVPRIPPAPGDVWRFNLYRLEHRERRRGEGSALSPPVVPDFHRPERFARLVFDGPPTSSP